MYLKASRILWSAALATALFAVESPAEFASLRDALPAHTPGDAVIEHTGYTLLYREDHEQAAWVAYVLTEERLGGTSARRDNFRADPSVPTGSATPADYRASGYDRGHLAPAADMKWSEKAMSESFYMSNMSPQAKEFNRGIWEHLESRVREWAKADGELFIVAGPVLEPGLKTIGGNGISVPRMYYKVVLDYRLPVYKAIGFLMPNEGATKPLDDFAVTVDAVERATAIDFFPALPDSLESVLEGSLRPAEWGLTGAEIAAAPVAARMVSDDTAARKHGAIIDTRTTVIITIIVLVVIALIILFALMKIGEAVGLFGRKRK